MSEVLSGVVDSIHTKDVAIKNGPKAGTMSKVYHASIAGHDVNLGFQTKLAEGEKVTLHVEHKYGGYQILSTPAPAGTQTVGSQPQGAAVGAKTGGASAFPVALGNNGTSIVRQSSLNRAIEAVHKLIDVGLFKPVDEAAYQNKVFDYAYMFTDFGTGQREVKEAAARTTYDEQEAS